MRGLLGEDGLVELQGAVGVAQALLPQSREAEGQLAPLGTLPLLRAAHLQREGQVLGLVQLGVETLQVSGGLAARRIPLGQLPPELGGTPGVLQPVLLQQRGLAHQRGLLRGLQHAGRQPLQDRGQLRPALAGTVQPLQAAQGVDAAGLPLQHRMELAHRRGAIVELLLVQLGELAMERGRERSHLALQDLLEHLGEALQLIRVLGGLPRGDAQGGVRGGHAHRAGQGGEGELRLAQVEAVGVGGLAERLHAADLILRRAGDGLQRDHQLAVVLDHLVGRDQGTRRLLAAVLLLQQPFEGGERVRIGGALSQHVGVALHRLRAAAQVALQQLGASDAQAGGAIGVPVPVGEGDATLQRAHQRRGLPGLLQQLVEPRQVPRLVGAGTDRLLQGLGGGHRALQLRAELDLLQQQAHPLAFRRTLDPLVEDLLRLGHAAAAHQQAHAVLGELGIVRQTARGLLQGGQRLVGGLPLLGQLGGLGEESPGDVVGLLGGELAEEAGQLHRGAQIPRQADGLGAEALVHRIRGHPAQARIEGGAAVGEEALVGVGERGEQPLLLLEILGGAQLHQERGHLPLVIAGASVVRRECLTDVRWRACPRPRGARGR